MFLDLFSSICAEPSSWITLEKAGHDTLCFPSYVGREYEWVHKDPLVHCIHIFVIEWWKTSLAIDWHASRCRQPKCSPSSHTTGRQGSTNQQSWCNLGSRGVPARYTLESHRMLTTPLNRQQYGNHINALFVFSVSDMFSLQRPGVDVRWRSRWTRRRRAKVTEGYMTGVVQQDVFWLQIAVYDVEAMQMLQCTKQLCGVEPTAVLVELAFSLQMIE